MSDWVFNKTKNRYELKANNKIYAFYYLYNPKIKGWTDSNGNSYGTRRVTIPGGSTYHFGTDGSITNLNILLKNNWRKHRNNLRNITNRYNPNNDINLDSIVYFGRLSGHNSKMISAEVANAIQEHSGNPSKSSNGRSGLFQNGANQFNRVGTTVESSMRALDEDIKFGRLPLLKDLTKNNTDYNGWIPIYLKIFLDSSKSANQVGRAFGRGYERYTDNVEADTKVRGELSLYIYDNILKGK